MHILCLTLKKDLYVLIGSCRLILIIIGLKTLFTSVVVDPFYYHSKKLVKSRDNCNLMKHTTNNCTSMLKV